jgi:hypothetical protein
MLRKTLILAAVLMTAAQAPKPAAFDARDPGSHVALLASLEATAEVASKQDDSVLLKVTSPVGGFTLQFAGCNAAGKACQAAQFDAAGTAAPTLAQINGFNQSSLTCRIVQDRAGKPHVLYSALLLRTDTRDAALNHVAAWRGCLGDFGAFLNDPPGYLAAAP